MKIPLKNSQHTHLTYCLNIHRGETWEENFEAVREHATAVRDELAWSDPFGLGLRISHTAAAFLHGHADERRRFKEFMAEQRLYAYTINGFPYGQFHGTRVKENVYAPDWRTAERRDYTNQLTDVLADLLEEGTTGSISTVPCSFKPWIKTEEDIDQMVRMICDSALHMHKLQEEQGTYIHLGLEPEPCCYLETTDEFIHFYKDELLRKGRRYLADKVSRPEEMLRKQVGINFDCCHIAIQYEELCDSLNRLMAEGVLLSKIHISAALTCTPDHLPALEPFDEPVYFHQVKARQAKSPEILSWDDLAPALKDLPDCRDVEELRCHFHVPLFWEGSERLGTTAAAMTPEFFAMLKKGICEHLEIETYTFDVLPPELQKSNVVESITPEFRWVMDRLS
jgi:hypothetical protein